MATRPRTSRPFRWTRAHLERLPGDGQRYEVLNGALLVTPQARLAHQAIAAQLLELLRPYCRQHNLGIAVGPGAVVWDDNELQPDVQVIPISEERARSAEWDTVPLPILVVEILSSGSVRHDRGVKRAAYLALGIPAYWVVDIDARTVGLFAPGSAEPVAAATSVRWQPRGDLPPYELDLSTLFGR